MSGYFIDPKNLSVIYLRALSFFIALCLLTIANGLSAQPEQRIIIQFQQPLTQESSDKFDRYLKDLLKNNYKVADHSSKSRWILIIPLRLTTDVIKDVIKNIKTNTTVQYAELDQLLGN